MDGLGLRRLLSALLKVRVGADVIAAIPRLVVLWSVRPAFWRLLGLAGLVRARVVPLYSMFFIS